MGMLVVVLARRRKIVRFMFRLEIILVRIYIVVRIKIRIS